MIIDKLANSGQYLALHPGFKAAFDHLASIDLNALEVGKYDVDGVKYAVMAKDGATKEAAGEKFECHDKNIDIQVLISGVESMGWTPRNDCKSPKADYNAEKDVTFYADAAEMYFTLHAGEFVIFYPNDVHAPMIGDGFIKKLVVKVPIG